MKVKNPITPMIPIAWVLIYSNDRDEYPQAINDPWEVWGILTDLQHDYRSRIELRYEEVDKAFIVTVTLDPLSLRDAYLAGLEKGKEEKVSKRYNR